MDIPNYRIRPLATVTIEVDMAMFTYRMNYGQKIRVPTLMWYLEGGDQRILVDSGASLEFAEQIMGVEAEGIMTFEEALDHVGVTPDDIDMVIQTHLHRDHCVHTSRCKNAKVVVQEKELMFALSPHPVVAGLYHRPLLKDLNFRIVNGYCEIVPGIELIPAPGHTPGVQAVCVRTDQGKAIISGFCCVKENFQPPEDVREICPVLAPGLHNDALEAFESVLRIKGSADIIIPQHDPQFLTVDCIP